MIEPSHRTLVDVLQGPPATYGHGHVNLISQDSENMLDARGTGDGKPPEVRAADHDGRCPEGSRLQDVRSASNAAVEQNRSASAQCVGDLG